MAIPDGYLMLQAVAFGTSLISNYEDYSDQVAQTYAQRDAAYRQVALNQNLYFSSQLHLNELEILETKKHHLDKFALFKFARKTRAAEIALVESAGGDTGSGTGASRVNNITRQALHAQFRKDLNFDIALRDLANRRANVTAETLSKNNQAFSGLSTGPSATGLVLNNAGLAIDKFAEVGYSTNDEGKIVSRWSA